MRSGTRLKNASSISWGLCLLSLCRTNDSSSIYVTSITTTTIISGFSAKIEKYAYRIDAATATEQLFSLYMGDVYRYARFTTGAPIRGCIVSRVLSKAIPNAIVTGRRPH